MSSVLLVLAHPRPGSLNHAVTERITSTLREQGRTVHVHDLYAEGFDPVLRAEEAYTTGRRAADILDATTDPLVRAHREELSRASGLVVVHPNWWGKPPAIMAGWMDRVLVPGVAYRLDEAAGTPTPLLGLRAVLVVNTSDTPAERETAEYGDPLESIWKRCLGPYLGAPAVDRVVLRVVSDADAAQRARWLDDVGARAGRMPT